MHSLDHAKAASFAANAHKMACNGGAGTQSHKHRTSTEVQCSLMCKLKARHIMCLNGLSFCLDANSTGLTSDWSPTSSRVVCRQGEQALG